MPEKTHLLGPELKINQFAAISAEIGNYLLRNSQDATLALKAVNNVIGGNDCPANIVAVYDPRYGPAVSIVDSSPAGQDVSVCQSQIWSDQITSFTKKEGARSFDVRKGMSGWVYLAYVRQLAYSGTDIEMRRHTLITGEPRHNNRPLVGYLDGDQPKLAAIKIGEQIPDAFCYRPAITFYTRSSRKTQRPKTLLQ